MGRVVPWQDLNSLTQFHYREGGRWLRIHLLQNWFGYSISVMEEALFKITILR